MTIKKRKRLLNEERKAMMLKVAMNLSTEIGYTNITSRVIAERSGVRVGLLFYYFETMENLRKLIMRTAIEQEVLNIILQGICISDPIAMRAPPELKEKARRG